MSATASCCMTAYQAPTDKTWLFTQALRSIDEWQTETAGLAQASTYVPAPSTAYGMWQVCAALSVDC